MLPWARDVRRRQPTSQAAVEALDGPLQTVPVDPVERRDPHLEADGPWHRSRDARERQRQGGRRADRVPQPLQSHGGHEGLNAAAATLLRGRSARLATGLEVGWLATQPIQMASARSVGCQGAGGLLDPDQCFACAALIPLGRNHH